MIAGASRAAPTAGPFHSDVPRQAHSARFPVSTRTHREVLALMDRAEEKAEPKDVGEQALMRELDTAFPFFRLGLSWSSVGLAGNRRGDYRSPLGPSARVTGSARTVWFALSTQSRARVSVRPRPLAASLGSRAADIDSSRPPPQECVAPAHYRPW